MFTSIQSLVIALFLLFFLYTLRKGGEGYWGKGVLERPFCRSVFCTFDYLMSGAMTNLCSLEDKSGNLYLQIYDCISKNEAMLKICLKMFKGH